MSEVLNQYLTQALNERVVDIPMDIVDSGVAGFATIKIDIKSVMKDLDREGIVGDLGEAITGLVKALTGKVMFSLREEEEGDFADITEIDMKIRKFLQKQDLLTSDASFVFPAAKKAASTSEEDDDLIMLKDGAELKIVDVRFNKEADIKSGIKKYKADVVEVSLK